MASEHHSGPGLQMTELHNRREKLQMLDPSWLGPHFCLEYVASLFSYLIFSLKINKSVIYPAGGSVTIPISAKLKKQKAVLVVGSEERNHMLGQY